MDFSLPLYMVGALFLGIFSGFPIVFVLGGISIIFIFLGDIPFSFIGTMVSRIYATVMNNWLMIAVPLFILMGCILEKTGLAIQLLRDLAISLRRVPGGTAIAVALIGIVLAASMGVVGASVVMLGVLSLPMMLESKYRPDFAAGIIMAASTLGILIPPSVMLVVIGDLMQVSVGALFAGAMIPGLILGGLYIFYIVIVAYFQPHIAPPLSSSNVSYEIDEKGTKKLIIRLMGPLFLIGSVLGSIMAGIATPTEAAGIGALGALVLAIVTRKISFKDLKLALFDTTKMTGMVMWILVGATCFSVVFKRLGGDLMVEYFITSMSLGPWQFLIIIFFIVFILGFVLDWVEIVFILLPIFGPMIIKQDFGLGLSPEETAIWFSITMAILLQTSFLTPPFGFTLFYLKGVSGDRVSTVSLYKGAIPYVALQIVGLLLCLIFPSIVLFLPRMI